EETLAVQAIEETPPEEVAADAPDDENYEKETLTIEPPSAETYEEVEEVEEADVSMVMEPPAAQEVAPEVAGEAAEVETIETREPVRALVEPDPEAIMEADRLIEAGDYIKAMDVYNDILKKAPDSGPVLQRVQELKLLLKVHGLGGVLVEHRLDKFLSAIQRRRDEFYANP
ncbi:hypothetical protein LCGC14_1553490, partial [marine sediment metagenome]